MFNQLRVFVSLFTLFNLAYGQLETSGSVYQGCNHTILEGQGVVLSPNYPALYDANNNCQWRITVEQDRNILLSFRYFDIERSPNCAFDSVSIYNGPTTAHPQLGKFCGAFRPGNVMTTSNRMLMTLKTDDSTQKTGFVAVFASVAPQIAGPNSCGGLLHGSEGSFHSVNYPKANYPNSLTCVWHIRTSPDRIISLRFDAFRLEVSRNCKYDAVTIFSGWSTSDDTRFIGRFCETEEVPAEIVSAGNEMFITLATDSSGNDEGISARYSTSLAPTISSSETTVLSGKPKATEATSSVCSRTVVLTTDTGVVVSPGYKETSGYDPNLRCSWRIETRPGTTILLRFQNFEVERDDECIFDYVSVYSGIDSGGDLLGRYCGDTIAREIRSSSNHMYIVFVSDSGGNAPGFRAVYATEYRATTISETVATTTRLVPTMISREAITTALTTETASPDTPTACPEPCGESADYATKVCSAPLVTGFKVLTVRTSETSGTRLRVVLLKSFKKVRGGSGQTRKGTKLWIEIPDCPQCFPTFVRKSKHLIAGAGLEEILDPSDYLGMYRKKKVKKIRKAIRRCNKVKRRSKRRKRGSKKT